MRLICPNCDAEYEVDEAAIPHSGRDVQCSSCGHAWFQAHPEMVPDAADEMSTFAPPAAESAPQTLAELDDPAEPAVEPEEVLAAEAIAPESPRLDDAAEATAPSTSSPEAVTEPPPADLPAEAQPEMPRRTIDESVLAVLREEAEREAAARRGERPRIETQTEMTLPEAPRPPAMAPVPEEPVAPPVPEAPRKRSLLPEIEEIKSSLHPTLESDEDEAPGAEPQRGGFRSGFVFAVLIAVILMALYVMAPVIAAKVPALAGVLDSYVRFINGLRVMLDQRMRALIGWLQGLAGGSAG